MFIFGFFTLGILIGSFLNVAIYRIPKGESIVLPASKCQSCHSELKWYHNIPVFSWLFLRGKCGFCKSKIAAQYPIIELINGLGFAVLYYIIGLSWILLVLLAIFSIGLVLLMIKFNK